MKWNQFFLHELILVLCKLFLTHLLISQTNWKQTIDCRFAQFTHWVLLKLIFYCFLITFLMNEMPTCFENNVTVERRFFLSFNHLLINIGELHETHELEFLLLLALTTDYTRFILLLRLLLLLYFLFILHFISNLFELITIRLFKLFLVLFELCLHFFFLFLKFFLSFFWFQKCLLVERFHWVLIFHMALLRLIANYFDQVVMENWKIRLFFL